MRFVWNLNIILEIRDEIVFVENTLGGDCVRNGLMNDAGEEASVVDNVKGIFCNNMRSLYTASS